MTVIEFWNKLTVGGLAGWAVMLLLILMSLIQIAPVKLNPWDKIFAWLGKKMNGHMQKQLDELRKQVRDMWVNNHRNQILIFAREARGGIEHSSDEWTNILNMIADYETFCEENKITNGIVKADSEYIRNLYQELSREHRI